MKKRITVLLLSIGFSGFSQVVRSPQFEDVNFKKAKAFYEEGKYDEAVPLLEQVSGAAPNNQDVLYYLGSSYNFIDQAEKAIIQFEKLEKINPEYWAWFYYEAGNAFSRLKNFESAIAKYETFLSKYPHEASNTKLIHQGMYRLHYARRQKELQDLKPKIKPPVKLPATANSPFDDYMPLLNPTGTKLYFTSQRLGGISPEEETEKAGDEDVYFIEKVNGAWGLPQLLPEPINSASNEGAACFSADGQTMVYTACGREGGVGSCDLYLSTLEGSEWSKPINIGNVVNTDGWDAQPTISSDGDRIIFASSRPGGYGAEDLYMIERNLLGEWGPSANLGGVVNTPFSDSSPFLSQDGKTLYFASDGHPGYGGYDLFMTVMESGKWNTPVNLGRPLNTDRDDRYFTIGGSGEIGYFASDRDNTQLDLYEVEIPEEMRPRPTVVVTGTVTNAKNGNWVGAYVMVEDINTGELIAINRSNSSTGKYLVVLPSGRNYSVSTNKEGFFFFSQRFDVPAMTHYQEIQKDIPLKPIEKGARVVLNNIFFETGKATLSPQSRLELEKAIELMKTNPSMTIEIGGHTDNVGEDALNMKLSHDRAKSVREYLVSAGIASGRLQAKGYGELNPVATNDTEEGRKLNRRTEFVILEF